MFPRYLRIVLLFVLVLLPLCDSLSAAEDISPQELLRLRYREFADRLPVTGLPPIEVRSLEDDEVLRAEVFGILGQPFSEVGEALLDPSAWCRFVPLNFNVKACTHRRLDGKALLIFYAGRKIYQSPEEAFRLEYLFEIRQRTADYFQVGLVADEGPMGTSDYHLLLEAMPVEEGTFVRFRSSYRSSLWSRMATSGYLATLGRDKVGFSIVGYDSEGEPIYVQGVKGIIERNAVRYFMALKAYMRHRELPPDRRFERLLDTWYRYTENYPRQLHEQDHSEYLDIKRRERKNQQRLQQELGQEEEGEAGFRRPPGQPAAPKDGPGR